MADIQLSRSASKKVKVERGTERKLTFTAFKTDAGDDKVSISFDDNTPTTSLLLDTIMELLIALYPDQISYFKDGDES